MSKVIERWNSKYAPEEFIFGQNPNDFLVKNITQLIPHGKTLVPGDGEGRNGVWLAKQGLDVLSIDGAINGVNKAIRYAQDQDVTQHFQGQCADLLEWDWPTNSFDNIVSLHIHFYKDEKRQINKAMYDALKEGGIFLFEAFHPDQVGRDSGGPQDVNLCYSADELAQDFKNCDILHLEECEKEINAAPHRSGGTGIVSRIIARK